jgi:hypothetical protein
VTLTASSSGQFNSFAWSQTQGAPVSVVGANTPTLTFEAPKGRTLVNFEVRALTAYGQTVRDTVAVQTNTPPSLAPLTLQAKAGTPLVVKLAPVDEDGDLVTLTVLNAPEGVAVVGDELTWAKPILGRFVVRLQVSDGLAQTATEVVIESGGSTTAAPSPNPAGAQSATTGGAGGMDLLFLGMLPLAGFWARRARRAA